jgi:GTP-binding protein
MLTSLDKLRNIAIIAHVDHGKTTLVDGLLKQSGTVAAHKQLAERAMDTNDLERERGITILSKCTSVKYGDFQVNIVDTPGHADFGGEVERVLKMVDSVLLLVDAFEGPMPQTRFVLSKALELGHKPIVVINKIDRPDSRPDEVLDLVFDLFAQLEATDEQLDFAVVYASAKMGYALAEIEDYNPEDTEELDLIPLFDTILAKVDPPAGAPDAPLRMQVATLSYNSYLGRLAIGRVYDGSIKRGQQVLLCRGDGTQSTFKISKIFGFNGLEQVARETVGAGDICAIAGLEGVLPGETVCEVSHPNPMPLIKVDEPTVSMRFSINTSGFAGQEGKYVTSRQIKGRLEKELEHNVALRVELTDSADAFKVSGRGELHLSILIETMRREGYELSVGRPRVITREIDGQLMEPIEELVVDVDDEYAGSVIDHLNRRKGDMREMKVGGTGITRLAYQIPTRGLIGFRSDFLTETRGTGVMYHNFDHYGAYRGETPSRQNGAMVALEKGETTAYALHNLQERGTMLVGAGQPVYSGQLVGINSRDNDIVVNPCKRKHLTNVRASGTDDSLRLTPHRVLSLEAALELIDEDELVEVTPKSIRLRKAQLDHTARKRESKRKA